MRVVIVGAGTMGCLFAAKLALAGSNVTLVDIHRCRLARIAENGLALRDDDGEHRIPVGALVADEVSEPADLLLLLTKALHTAVAARSVSHLDDVHCCALTLQDGLGNAEAIAEVFPLDRTLLGVTDWPADPVPPELIADLRTYPGKRSFGSPAGSSLHLAAETVTSETGTYAVHVPYRGAGIALTDLLGGQIDFLFDPGIAIQHVNSGKLRMLTVASMHRAPLMPDVSTLDELGLKGFDVDAVFGLYAPAGTPQPVIERLSAEVNRAVNAPATKERVVAMGNVPLAMTPAEFGRKVGADSRRMGSLIRERADAARVTPS